MILGEHSGIEAGREGKHTGGGLRVQLECCTNLVDDIGISVNPCAFVDPAYLFVEAVVVKSVVQVDKTEEMTHGWKHALADVVPWPVRFPCPSRLSIWISSPGELVTLKNDSVNALAGQTTSRIGTTWPTTDD